MSWETTQMCVSGSRQWPLVPGNTHVWKCECNLQLLPKAYTVNRNPLSHCMPAQTRLKSVHVCVWMCVLSCYFKGYLGSVSVQKWHNRKYQVILKMKNNNLKVSRGVARLLQWTATNIWRVPTICMYAWVHAYILGYTHTSFTSCRISYVTCNTAHWAV